MNRLIRTTLATAMLVLSLASVAAAGMMPVVSFTGVPSEFDQGTPYQLDFTVMAHGVEPIELAGTMVRFQGPNGEVVTFPGETIGPGMWTVEVTLPVEGEWRMDVLTEGQVLQSFGTVSVAAPASGPGPLGSLRIALPIATLLAVLVLVAQVLALVRVARGRAPVSDVG